MTGIFVIVTITDGNLTPHVAFASNPWKQPHVFIGPIETEEDAHLLAAQIFETQEILVQPDANTLPV